MAGVDELEQQSSEGAGRREGVWVVAVIFATALLLLARAPFAVSKFWAEDGTVFFQGARQEGAFGAFGVDWAGYYHLVPRIAGAFSSSVPIDLAPLANWLIIAVVVAWCAATLFVASKTWIASMPARLVLTAGIVLLPVVRVESIGNVANLHFIMLFPALLVMICRPQSRSEWVNGSLFVLVSTLSTLETAVFFPFAAYRVWTRKPRGLDPITIVWALGSAVHFGVVFVAGPERAISTSTSLPSIVFNYGKRVVFDNFSPVYRLSGVIGTVLVVALSFVIVRAVMVSWSKHREIAFLLVAVPAVGALLWVVLGERLGGTTPRYAVFPAMCLTWSLFVATETLARRFDADHRSRRWGAVTLVPALVLVAWLPHWAPPAYRGDGPTWRETLSAAEDQCRAEGGEFVTVQVPPSTADQDLWPVQLECADLLP